MTDLTPQEASEIAAHTAKNAQQAVELSREAHQKELVGQTKEALMEALTEVFGKGDNVGSGEMNILVRRIPLICQEIAQIHTDIKETKESVASINTNITWGIRLILGAVLLALLKLILIP